MSLLFPKRIELHNTYLRNNVLSVSVNTENKFKANGLKVGFLVVLEKLFFLITMM